MAVGVIDPSVLRPQRFLQNALRVRDEVASIHRDASFGAYEAGAAIGPDRFAGVAFGVDDHAVAVMVVDLALLIGGLDRRGHIRVDDPLDNVVVLSLIHISEP